MERADLISRAAAIEALSTPCDKRYRHGVWETCLDNIETAIRNIPAVDAAPVVFCKDCKYAHMTYGGEVKYCDRISMPDDEGDYGYALYLPGDWFCAAGERRDSE